MLERYDLSHVLQDIGSFPTKLAWKGELKKAMEIKILSETQDCMANDSDFDIYRHVVHEFNLTPSRIWQSSLMNPENRYNMNFLVMSLVAPTASNAILCEHCGLFYKHELFHLALTCAKSEMVRNWFCSRLIEECDDNLLDFLSMCTDIEVFSFIHGSYQLPKDESWILMRLGGQFMQRLRSYVSPNCLVFKSFRWIKKK